MAVDFDQFPIYDGVLKISTPVYLSDVWSSAFSTFFQTLIGYLTQNGVLVPNLDQDQVNAISFPQSGQLLYNTTTNELQVYKNGDWKNIMTS